MKYRKLGASDLAVSEISLGSWLTFGAGVDDASGRACVNAAASGKTLTPDLLAAIDSAVA